MVLVGGHFLMSEVPLWSISLSGKAVVDTRSWNNSFTEMCSGSEAGSFSRLIDFVCHSTLGLGVMKKKEEVAATTILGNILVRDHAARVINMSLFSNAGKCSALSPGPASHNVGAIASTSS